MCKFIFIRDFDLSRERNNEPHRRKAASRRVGRKEKRFVEGFCTTPVSFGKIGMLP